MKYKMTTMILDEDVKELIREYSYIDEATNRTDWIKKMISFRYELNEIPQFKDKPLVLIIDEIREAFDIRGEKP